MAKRRSTGKAKGKAKGKARGTSRPPAPADPMAAVLATFRDPLRTDWGNAWVGIEPTFSSQKAVRKWAEMSATEEGEDAYFSDEWMMKTEKRVGKAIERRYAEWKADGRACCMFDRVEREVDADPWGTKRQNLHFHWRDRALEDFEVKLSIDPEIFEYGIKPIPVAWLYDDRFVDFLQAFVWDPPLALGLTPTIAHGGGQFSLSAKTYMTGSLLADDIAYRLAHPELATWTMDWPNCDDRSFRATPERFQAFRRILDEYWEGRFHPRAAGVLTVEHALLERGFEPAHVAMPDAMDPAKGPLGEARDVFQTNFAFGRAVRWRAQYVHPGYWLSAHPEEDGYRFDQIMRYSEGNLNRLQIRGELHVKSGDVLQVGDVPPLEAPLDASMLAKEASWEDRAQMSRTSARDFVEAILLDVHHAMWLQRNPHVAVPASLLQDQLMLDGEETLKRRKKGRLLSRLQQEARAANLEASRGRVRSDWIEPEALFWNVWHALLPGERAEIAREAVIGFRDRVHQAASVDPRGDRGDPMEAHRHRVHPLLWHALERQRSALPAGDAALHELDAWRLDRERYLTRRPPWSYGELRAPWER